MRKLIPTGIVRNPPLLCAVLCLTLAAGSTATVEAGSLKMRVSLKDTKVCKGTKRIDVQVEITNKREEPITFQLTELGYIYNYRREPTHPDSGGLNAMLLNSVPLSSEMVTLKPGASFRFEVNIPFPSNAIVSDTPFQFSAILIAAPPDKKPKDVKVFKGEVESNRIRFEYSDCSGPSR